MSKAVSTTIASSIYGYTREEYPDVFAFLDAILRAGDAHVDESTLSKDLWNEVVMHVKASRSVDADGKLTYPTWHFTFASDIQTSSDYPYEKNTALPSISQRIKAILKMAAVAKERAGDTVSVPTALVSSLYDKLTTLQSKTRFTLEEYIKHIKRRDSDPEYRAFEDAILTDIHALEFDVLELSSFVPKTL